MCLELDALRQSITAFATGFDGASVLPSEAARVVRICAQMEASIASVKALAAARSAESNAWRHEGYRSASEQLARDAGMSPGAARRALETGRRMAEQPDVAQAAQRGELTLEQAEAVSDGVAANPAKARELIDKAKQSSMPELNEEVARTKAQATDQEARRKAIHAKRSFRRWTDRDGAYQAHMYGNPEDGTRLWQVLDPIRRRIIMLRRGQDPNEKLDALDFDAVMAMAAIAAGEDGELGLRDLIELGLFPQLDASHLRDPSGLPEPAQLSADAAPVAPEPAPVASAPAPVAPEPALFAPAPAPVPSDELPTDPKRRQKKLAGSPARVMVRVDLDTLLRGVPIDGELCEIVGYGPVPVSVVNELIANGNTFLVGVLTRSHQVLGVYHHGRHPNAYQRSALDFLYPTCAVRGCSVKDHLHYDHREDWKNTKFTLFDWIDRFCRHHDYLKTHKDWALVPGVGKRDFVPPDDPRHPKHHPPPVPP